MLHISGNNKVKTIVNNYFSSFGVTITTDQRRQFKSNLFQFFLKVLRFQKTTKAAFHHQSNVPIDDFIAVLKFVKTINNSA